MIFGKWSVGSRDTGVGVEVVTILGGIEPGVDTVVEGVLG